MSAPKLFTSPFNIAVVAAGLGFFIDAFDLFLFSIYRIPSLTELGLTGKELLSEGEWLLSVQMAGMMIGGLVTGIIGDKRGRVAVLFGSILLYSSANIANAFVHDTTTYALIRFLAGVGLAGELGAGITLVSETMTVHRRGYGTILVASLGALGAVSAGLAGDFLYWRHAFFIAGVAGLLLLVLRLNSLESHLFHKTANRADIHKGSFFKLLSSPRRTMRYLACISMGVPIWYSVGLLISLSPELAKEGQVDWWKLTTAFTLFQIGVTTGDLSSGIISQRLRNRKKTIVAFMSIAILGTIAFFYGFDTGVAHYTYCLIMGFGCGYLSVFLTTLAERFGTNYRVLVTSTVTNFMRGSVTLMIPLRIYLEQYMTLWWSLVATGIIVWILALASTLWLEDTYGKDLDFTE